MRIEHSLFRQEHPVGSHKNTEEFFNRPETTLRCAAKYKISYFAANLIFVCNLTIPSGNPFWRIYLRIFYDSFFRTRKMYLTCRGR